MELVRQKNAATYITFPLVDADGDLVSSAGSLDSELDAWTDGAAPDGFADCTNEATEIGTTGMYYLSLTQTEMNNDYIIIQIKSTGAKTQVILIRTQVGDPLNAAVTDDGTAINVASGVVEAQVKSIDNNAITAASLAADAGAEIADAVWDEDATGHQTGGTFGQAIGDPGADTTTIYQSVVTDAAGTNIAADIIAIEAQTDDIGAAGAGLTAVPWNAAWDAEVQSEVQDAIEANHLDHLLAVTYDPASKPGAADALLNELVESDAGVSRYTANALEQAPTGGSAPTVAEIADGVWDEARSGHVTDGTFGQAAQVVRSGTAQAGAASTVTLDASASATNDLYNGGVVYILSGTGAGQARSITDYDGTTKVATVDTAWTVNPDNTSVFVIYPSPIGASTADIVDAVWDEATSGHTTAGTTGKALTDAGSAGDPWSTAVPGAYGAGTAGKILGDNLNATVSSRASQTSVDTIDDLIDTEVAAIKAQTDKLTFDGSNRVAADAQAISADSVAADRLETMLDGTGGNVLSLSQLNINNASGVGLLVQGGDLNEPAVKFLSTGSGISDGLLVTGAGSGADISGNISGNITGNLSGSIGSLAAQAQTDVRTATGLAAANLDTQLTAINDAIDTEVAAIKAKTDNLPASPAATGDAMALTSAERNSVADALLDRADAIETGLTLRQAHRLMAAALAGKLSGAGTTTITIRNAVQDSKARITATVDADGNRSAITADVS